MGKVLTQDATRPELMMWSLAVCGTPSGPVNEQITMDVLEERESTTIRGGGDIT